MDVDSGSLQSIRDSTQNPANHAPSVAGGRDRANQTSMKTKLSIGGMGLVSALACVTGTPPAAVAAPRALSYEEKVLASDYVIIGTVIRIICREYDPARHRVLDVEDERCNDGWSRTTDWVIEAEALLCRKTPPDPHVLLRITPATELCTVGRQRRHYSGRKMIFFLRRALVSRRDGSTVEALRFAKGRRTVFPQPLSTLEKLVPALNKHCRN